MAIRHFNPVTPGQRKKSTLVNEELTKTAPEKSLLKAKSKKSGRNNQGRITVRHQGGGAKQKYRLIDFKRNKHDIEGTVASIEYDPNRSANIALINYVDGEKRYIIAPKGLKVGMKIVSGENVDIKVGNALPIMNIPVGTVIHNIEMRPGKGAQIARSAGQSAQILGREERYVLVRLSSGETRKIVEVARIAKARSATVIALTGFFSSTIGRLADYTLYCSAENADTRENDINSRLGMFVVIDMLVTIVKEMYEENIFK